MKHLGIPFRHLCLLVLLLVAGLSSCKTRATLSSKVTLGMTKEQVVHICGEPFKQGARYDEYDNLVEAYFYKEKVWLNGFWSSQYTIANHIMVFQNGVLIAIEQGDEQHSQVVIPHVWVGID